MAKRKILVLEHEKSSWLDFLNEYFEDTRGELIQIHPSELGQTHFLQGGEDIVFVAPDLISISLRQKLNVLRGSVPSARVIGIGEGEIPKDIRECLDECFCSVPSFQEFQKRLMSKLPLPETIRVLIVDDEREVAMALEDYLKERETPVFEVTYAENGEVGLEAVKAGSFDVVVLDVKMPVKDGREVYRDLCRMGSTIPVIIFFDAVSGDEVVELHTIGRPAIVEKGSYESTMPTMLNLIKKMVYFG